LVAALRLTSRAGQLPSIDVADALLGSTPRVGRMGYKRRPDTNVTKTRRFGGMLSPLPYAMSLRRFPVNKR
jgi:hypothetical protein